MRSTTAASAGASFAIRAARTSSPWPPSPSPSGCATTAWREATTVTTQRVAFETLFIFLLPVSGDHDNDRNNNDDDNNHSPLNVSTRTPKRHHNIINRKGTLSLVAKSSL